MDEPDQTQRQIFSSTVTKTFLLILPAVFTLFCGIGSPSGEVDVEATVAAGIVATQQAEANLQATIDAAVAATQAASQSAAEDQLATPSTSATTISVSPTAIPDPELVRSVILAEVEATVAQDLDRLESLYTPNAIVIDRNGTPDDPSDDTTWRSWANIERRYQAFFSEGPTSISLVDLSIQMDGDQATGTHKGAVLDGTYYPDIGIYTLEKQNGAWLITELEYGNVAADGSSPAESVSGSPAKPGRDDGLYVLAVGSQHRYEQPWGWDRGDPCKAWETGDFDDTKPYYRGFNVELLLTNNSDEKAPDAWPISFSTAKGKSVKACYYGYEGSGPPPGATSSVTFFTVVEQGDYVNLITFSLNDQTVQLCLDGKGGWTHCSQ